jgi:hypothetical protein
MIGARLSCRKRGANFHAGLTRRVGRLDDAECPARDAFERGARVAGRGEIRCLEIF